MTKTKTLSAKLAALLVAILVPLALPGSPALADAPNLLCAIEPYDPVDETFRGGFGTPQVRVNRLLVKASDNGFVELTCVGAFTGPYTLTAMYRFEWSPSPGDWETLAGPWSCSQYSTNVGAFELAAISVPGSSCPEPRIVFNEDDPTLGYPHRFCFGASAGSKSLSSYTPQWVHEEIG